MCLAPMLAKLGDEAALTREGYIYEPKLDGIRTVCRKEGDTVALFNRHCVDITRRYPELDFGSAIRADSAVLDGELVYYNAQGNPDFTALMGIHHRGGVGRKALTPKKLRYTAFDIMERDGEDLTALPLVERKKVLAEVVQPGGHLELSLFTPDGSRLWDAIKKRNLEGVVAKRADGPYEVGRRSRSWVKIKSFQTIDCVIVGFSADKRALSSLGVALFDEDETLRFIGKVGTGFTDREIKKLRGLLDPLRIETSPAEGVPASYRNIEWVKPEHTCEVRFLEIGSQGMMRNPSYLRLRPDKKPEDCRMDQVMEAAGGPE